MHHRRSHHHPAASFDSWVSLTREADEEPKRTKTLKCSDTTDPKARKRFLLFAAGTSEKRRTISKQQLRDSGILIAYQVSWLD